MANIKIIEIKVESMSGANIHECLKDAIILSTNKWEKVRLTHNNKEFLIDPYKFIASISEKS